MNILTKENILALVNFIQKNEAYYYGAVYKKLMLGLSNAIGFNDAQFFDIKKLDSIMACNFFDQKTVKEIECLLFYAILEMALTNEKEEELDPKKFYQNKIWKCILNMSHYGNPRDIMNEFFDSKENNK